MEGLLGDLLGRKSASRLDALDMFLNLLHDDGGLDPSYTVFLVVDQWCVLLRLWLDELQHPNITFVLSFHVHQSNQLGHLLFVPCS